MKQLSIRNIKHADTDEDSASLIMSTIPIVMRAFKTEMRANRPTELSIPQFRTLIFLECRSGASISDVAGHLGLSLSTVSKIIDGLMKRSYVERSVASNDRRRAILALTAAGKTALKATREQAHTRMLEYLDILSPEEQANISEAMRILSRVFQPDAATGKETS